MRRWLRLPHTEGDWLYRAEQGLVQGQMFLLQILSSVASSPIRIPSRKTTQYCLPWKSHTTLFLSLFAWGWVHLWH